MVKIWTIPPASSVPNEILTNWGNLKQRNQARRHLEKDNIPDSSGKNKFTITDVVLSYGSDMPFNPEFAGD